MVMGSWHRNEQTRINKLLWTYHVPFYDGHGVGSDQAILGAFGFKLQPDFFVLSPQLMGQQLEIIIELFSARRVMDERNAVRLRYWSRQTKSIILITEGGIIEPLEHWLFLSGYFYNIRYINAHNLRYVLDQWIVPGP